MTAQPDHKTAALPDPTTPEAVLVTRAQQGDEPAIRELIRRMNPRLFRIARGIVASDADAEEVVQESYLKAFTKLDTFRAEARFSTWLIRITINSARMKLRASRPEEAYDTVTETRTAPGAILTFPGQDANMPDALLGRTQIRALLESTVAQLPSDLRLPFLMREAENMSVRAIARDLSLNPITVKTRLFRARRRLRAALEERIHGGFDAIFPFDGARCANMADRVVAGLRQS